MAAPKQPRQYMPLWEVLKKHSIVTVSVPAHLHKRVVKAVIKEKWMDMDYKFKEGWRMKYITYVTNAQENRITFFLNYKLTDILSKDL